MSAIKEKFHDQIEEGMRNTEPICIEYYENGIKTTKYCNTISFNHIIGQVYTEYGLLCEIRDLIKITN